MVLKGLDVSLSNGTNGIVESIDRTWVVASEVLGEAGSHQDDN